MASEDGLFRINIVDRQTCFCKTKTSYKTGDGLYNRYDMIQPISGNIGCGNQFSFTTSCSTPLANLSNMFCRCWTCTCCLSTMKRCASCGSNFAENFGGKHHPNSSEVLIRMRWVRQEATQIHMAVGCLGWDSVAPVVIQVNQISDGYAMGDL